MSKHLGNVIEPIGLLDAHGADAVRWFFAASGSPWGQRRIGSSVLAEIVRKVLLTYWNTVSFLVLYANASAGGGAGADPGAAAGAGGGGAAWTPEDAALAPEPGARPLLDRWLLSEVHACVREVTAALETFDTAAAGRRLAELIDDLSNWYVRRSRRRFWDGPGSPDGASAFATLHAALDAVTKMLAPITPFLSDYLWGVLRPADGPESVHLASWPAFDQALIDPALSAQMALARRIVELGRSARSAAAVRTRQPLSRALVGAAGFGSLPGELRDLVASELNVHSVESLDSAGGELVTYTVKPEFRSLGRRFGSATQAVAAVIRATDPVFLAHAVAAPGGSAYRGGPVRGTSDADRRGPRRDADAARGLGRGLRRRRDRRARPRRLRRAAFRGLRAGGRPADPGGAEGLRARCQRPDRRAVDGGGRRPGGGARRARPHDRGRGARGVLRPGRRRWRRGWRRR